MIVDHRQADEASSIQQQRAMIPPEEMDDAGPRLYLASKQGHTNQVRQLLMSRAPVDFVSLDENGQTPLFVASQQGHQEIASILIDFGASKDARCQVRSPSLSLAFSCIISQHLFGLTHFDADSTN